MKHKIVLKPDYKKIFTIAEMEYIRELQKDSETDATVESLLDVLSGGGEILKYEITWELNRVSETFWGNNVECQVHAYILHDCAEFREVWATFYDINSICNDEDRRKCGSRRVYKFASSHF